MTILQAGRVYDSLPPGQTMSREAFVKQAVSLTDPNRFHADTQTLLAMRSNAQAERTRIERALKQKGGV